MVQGIARQISLEDRGEEGAKGRDARNVKHIVVAHLGRSWATRNDWMSYFSNLFFSSSRISSSSNLRPVTVAAINTSALISHENGD